MLMKSKEFPYVTLHPIAKGRLTDLFLCYDPQAMKGPLIFLYKNDKISGAPPPS